MFQGQKILLISVGFFNYECIIANRIRELGGEVDLFDERPSNSILAKGIIRLKKDLYKNKINKYYIHLLEKIKSNSYDCLLLIKGEVVPKFFLEKLREINPQIRMIYYNYDSFYNNPNALEILPFFDEKYTFDREDAAKYQLNFRPLFFYKDYDSVPKYRNPSKYNLVFIGTAHTDRYIISQTVSIFLDNIGLNTFNYYYSPSKIVFRYKQFFDKTFKTFDIKKISFKSLTHQQIINIYKDAKVVLDINHPGQKGLTMRTFEALGAGRKLLTTNPEIKKYPFYNPNNIYIIDRNNIELNQDFFETNFEEINHHIRYQMSLDGWLASVFNKGERFIW